MWSTSSTLDAQGVSADSIWESAYSNVSAWPRWNTAIASAEIEGPFAVGTRVRVRFRTGLRLRFTLVEVEAGRIFTDESRLPAARMGHRHLIEPTAGGVRLVNTIYIDGPLARLWALVMGPPARRGLAGWQERVIQIARSA